VELKNPGAGMEGPLTEFLGEVVRRLLTQAVQVQLAVFLASNPEASYNEGRGRLVDN
jgi:hypothetical protein